MGWNQTWIIPSACFVSLTLHYWECEDERADACSSSLDHKLELFVRSIDNSKTEREGPLVRATFYSPYLYSSFYRIPCLGSCKQWNSTKNWRSSASSPSFQLPASSTTIHPMYIKGGVIWRRGLPCVCVPHTCVPKCQSRDMYVVGRNRSAVILHT